MKRSYYSDVLFPVGLGVLLGVLLILIIIVGSSYDVHLLLGSSSC